MNNKRKPEDYIMFPLDVATEGEAKSLLRTLSGKVGTFKVGLELFIGCGPGIIEMIQELGKAEVFLDLKLHDIPETVKRAMARVSELGVKFATVHCAESKNMLRAAVEGGAGKTNILGVTVLTSVSSDDLQDAGFKDVEDKNGVSALVNKRAGAAFEAGFSGVVCSGMEAIGVKDQFGGDFLAVTPGIRPKWAVSKGDDQKRVVTPEKAILNGADYLVIGRPIRDADDPARAAEMTAEEIGVALLKK